MHAALVVVVADPCTNARMYARTFQVGPQGLDEVVAVHTDLDKDVEGLELRGQRGDGDEAAVPCVIRVWHGGGGGWWWIMTTSDEWWQAMMR